MREAPFSSLPYIFLQHDCGSEWLLFFIFFAFAARRCLLSARIIALMFPHEIGYRCHGLLNTFPCDLMPVGVHILSPFSRTSSAFGCFHDIFVVVVFFFRFFPVIAPKRFCFFEFFRRSLEHSFWFMSSCVQIPPRFVSVCSECECGCWCFFALLFCFHFPVLKTPPSFQWDHNVCWLLGPFVYPFPSNTMAKKISRRALP